MQTIKDKYLEPLERVATIFLQPSEPIIIGLIAAFLLLRSDNNLIVSYFFSQWHQMLEGRAMQMGKPVNDEDDIKVVKKVAALYSRDDQDLWSQKGFKSLLKLH